MVSFPKSLSYTENIVVLCISFHIDGVEGVFEQSYLLAFGLKRLVLGLSLSAQALLSDMEGLNEDEQPLLEFLCVLFQKTVIPLRLFEQYLELEAAVRLVFASDLGLRGGLKGAVFEGGLFTLQCVLCGSIRTVYLPFQYSISCSRAMRSSLAASNSLLRALNCSCIKSFDSLGWLFIPFPSISLLSRSSKALSSKFRRRFCVGLEVPPA